MRCETGVNIPINVAGTAVTAKNGFCGYLQLGKPPWFRRQTPLLEVEEWMRLTDKRTLGERTNGVIAKTTGYWLRHYVTVTM